MANTFPTALNDWTANEVIESAWADSIEEKLGINSSSDATSIDYLLKNVLSSDPGHKHTLANGATDVTSSATELNILDGATLSVTELNYVDGVTSAIQTQFTGKAATDQTMYIGTTQVAINRASAALTLAGITLTTPDIGTPSAGTMTNVTGIPVSALANGTDGQLITWDASGVAATVAVGTATHVLTSNGVGAAPTFQAASAGGNKLGSTQLTGAAATITLSSLTEKERMKFMVGIVAAPASEIRLQFNGDAGNNYAWRVIENGGAGNTGTNATYISLTDTGNPPAANSSVIIEIEVINYASADKAVHAMGTFTGAATDATAPGGFWSTGHWDDSTNAITSITISNAAASNFGIGSYIIAYGDDA